MMKRNNKTFVIFMSTIFAVISLLTIDSQSQETLKGWKVLDKSEMEDIKWGTGLVDCSPIILCSSTITQPCAKVNGLCAGLTRTPVTTVLDCVDGPNVRCKRTPAGPCWTGFVCVESLGTPPCVWQPISGGTAYTCASP